MRQEPIIAHAKHTGYNTPYVDASLRYLPRETNLRDLYVEDNVLKTSFCAPFVAGGVAKTPVCDRGEALVQ